MPITFVRRSVALEDVDIETVDKLAEEKGLGARGFSAALRMIIREWIGYESRFRITEQGREALEEERQLETG
jgi:hypothetical protein